jgi:hypothetical protein
MSMKSPMLYRNRSGKGLILNPSFSPSMHVKSAVADDQCMWSLMERLLLDRGCRVKD